MTIQERLEQDFSQALKNKEVERLATLRLLKSAIKNQAIAKMKELDESDVILIIRTEMKKRQEASEAFITGNRPEQAAQETREYEMLKVYLPAEMSDEALKNKILDIRASLPEATKSNFGAVMGATVKAVGPAADGKRISEMVKNVLAEG